MGVEPLLAVGRSHNWWNPGGAHLLGGRWGWSRRRRDWSGASVGRWGRSQRQRDWCGSVIGVVQQSLRGAIGAVRLEPKAARLLGAVGGGVVGA
jgi:hypothetical protein